MLEKPPVATTEEDLKAYTLTFNSTVRHLIEKINAEYLYWDKVKHLTKEDQFPNRMLWFAAKKLRMFNYKYIQFGHYSFCYTLTDEILGLLHELDMNIGGKLSSERMIPAQDKNQYQVSAMGEQMILDNDQAINYIKDISQTNFSLEQLKEIHRLTTVNTSDNASEEGIIRKNDTLFVRDGTTGSTAHHPPSFTEIDNLLHELEVFFNTPGDCFIHPILKGIIIHFMLAYIHPFSEGNGRIARSLFYWYLLKQGYCMMEYVFISRIIYKSKRHYERAFLYTEYDENDLTYFILYNLRTMKNAFEALQLYLNRKTEESNESET
jgi:Fic family protein